MLYVGCLHMYETSPGKWSSPKQSLANYWQVYDLLQLCKTSWITSRSRGSDKSIWYLSAIFKLYSNINLYGYSLPSEQGANCLFMHARSRKLDTPYLNVRKLLCTHLYTYVYIYIQVHGIEEKNNTLTYFFVNVSIQHKMWQREKLHYGNTGIR